LSHPGYLTCIVSPGYLTCIVSPWCLACIVLPGCLACIVSPTVSPILSQRGVHLYCLTGIPRLHCVRVSHLYCLTGKPRLYSLTRVSHLYCLIQGSHLYYLTQGVAPWCDNTGETPRGLTPVKLASDYRPVCQQSWSQDLLLCRTRRSSLAVAGATASTHSCLPTEGWLRLGQPGCLVLCRGGLPVQMRSNTVTHPGTNRDGRRVTTLIASNALPLRHADTTSHKSQK